MSSSTHSLLAASAAAAVVAAVLLRRKYRRGVAADLRDLIGGTPLVRLRSSLVPRAIFALLG